MRIMLMDYVNNLPAQDPNIPASSPTANKTNQALVFIIVILLLIITGGGGFILAKYLYSPKPVLDPSTQQSVVNQPAANSFSNLTTEKVSTPPATVDETANWKTYTDTRFSFLVKYPQSWEIAPDPNSAPIAVNDFVAGNLELVLLDKTQPLYCGLYECFPSVQFMKPISDNRKIRLSLNNWVVEFIKSKTPNAKIDPNADLTPFVGGLPAVKFYNSVFVSRGNYVYVINFDFSGSSGGRAGVSEQATFDQILSTFKFLP